MSEATFATEAPSPGVTIRDAGERDLARIAAIYNHYIIETPITFDTDPVSIENRREWLNHFSTTGPHRLFVAEQDGVVGGYAGSHQFRPRKAYDTTIETTVYLAPESVGRGIGTLLYTAVFDAVRDEGLHSAVAGITMPNDASVAIHERFGFVPAGLLHEVGYKFGRYWDVAWYEKPLG